IIEVHNTFKALEIPIVPIGFWETISRLKGYVPQSWHLMFANILICILFPLGYCCQKTSKSWINPFLSFWIYRISAIKVNLIHIVERIIRVSWNAQVVVGEVR